MRLPRSKSLPPIAHRSPIATAVMTALGGVPGIEAAEVELGAAEVTCVAGLDRATTEAALRAAIEVAGFTVTAVTSLPRRLPTL